MAPKKVTFPVKVVNGVSWADLTKFGLTHEIVGEKVSLKDGNYSFAGGHRVRLYSFKKNVHLKVGGSEYDISDISVD